MAVPVRRTSKSKKRMRKSANLYKGVDVNFCPNCNAPVMPHRVCRACGTYKGKQVISAEV